MEVTQQTVEYNGKEWLTNVEAVTVTPGELNSGVEEESTDLVS